MKRDNFAQRPVPSPATTAHEEKILRRLFQGYPGGLAARLPSGATLTIGAHAPEFTLVFKHPGVIRDLILSQDPLQLAEAYISDHLDFEGNIYRVLAIKDYFQPPALSVLDRAALAATTLRLRSADPELANAEKAAPRLVRWRAPFSHKHTKPADRRAIGFHYDVSNEFYRLRLERAGALGREKLRRASPRHHP